MLVAQSLVSHSKALLYFQTTFPETGLVLVTEGAGLVEPRVLSALGMHAGLHHPVSGREMVPVIARAVVAGKKASV
ncbi:MAG: hypothetical protein HC848_04515 [Limnobacter sp.]|nr:hypothetical protein [Limnobacter sp.]